MEEWQIKHITKKLKQLIGLTTFNSILKTELVANNILCEADVDKLDAVQRQHGDMEACRQYYQLLLTRKGAYRVLYNALLETNQSGAYTILIRVPSDIFSKPLTYLGIPTILKNFQDADIEVQGKALKLHEFFPEVDLESLQSVFQNCFTETEIYDMFVTKEKKFVLASSSVPPKPPCYVTRFLSNRIKIDESIFKTIFPDVFVFKSTIERYKLSQMVKPHFTDASSSQLGNITSRFIYLDEIEDWIELKQISNVPIHLINYEADGNIFLLEDSSTPSDILKKLGSRKERVYISEDEFVQQHLSNNYATSNVGICDTPGMGKSLLLSSIAREITTKCTGMIIIYVSLYSFCCKFSSLLQENKVNHEKVLLDVLTYISPSKRTGQLLHKLVKTKFLRLKIFFDGLDEVPSEKIEWIRQVFVLITVKTPNISIYVTSRPHMRQELENTLGVVTYDILPFSQENQVNYLVKFWLNTEPRSNPISLNNYATSCLEAINKSLTKNDKEITGVPLLCHLIAETYAENVALGSLKSKFCIVPLKISKMYQLFIEKKIKIVAQNRMKMDYIKLIHIWHALKLLFPTHGFHEDNQFQHINGSISMSEILRVGILQKDFNSALEFIHRTFAEYFVAEHFFTKLQAKKNIPTFREFNSSSISILMGLLKCYKRVGNYDFMQSVAVFFVNSFLPEVNFSEELMIQAAKFVLSVSHNELVLMLCACCQQNLFNLFTFLKEAIIKCNRSHVSDCFTDENSYEILSVCIRKSSSQIFRSCIQFLTEVLKLDVTQMDTFHTHNTFLQLAVKFLNYEAVEYFVDKVSLQGGRVLESCVQYSYDNGSELVRRENILQLLLNKDPSLIHESPNILVLFRIHLRLLKILIEFEANLFCVDNLGRNFIISASQYMSPNDFFELIQYVLTHRKAENLFFIDEKWKDPLPEIIKWTPLLPQTLELLLKVPGIDINMKNKDGENLLFAAVYGTKLRTLQHLVSHGLDYNIRGWRNMSLLHVAAWRGDPDIVHYLLSLKLDPNAYTDANGTPLHYAAGYGRLQAVEILVTNGANLHTKNSKGQTALHCCVESSHEEVIKYLLDWRAEINARDNDGNTPLHLCKNKQVIGLLIKMGADSHAKNYLDETPAQRNPEQ